LSIIGHPVGSANDKERSAFGLRAFFFNASEWAAIPPQPMKKIIDPKIRTLWFTWPRHFFRADISPPLVDALAIS
jgi:hypothetical protein